MAQWLRLAAGASCLGPTSERWVDSATDHVRSKHVLVYPSLICCFRVFRMFLSCLSTFFLVFLLQPTATKALDPAEPRRVAAGRAPHEPWPHLPWCCGRGRVHAAAPWLDAAAGAMEEDVAGCRGMLWAVGWSGLFRTIPDSFSRNLWHNSLHMP